MMPAKPTTLAPRDRAHPSVTAWLLGVAAMVFAMVVIGGLTRLTESGLSIVEWQPLIGWLPPLDQASWQALFEKYKATPQFAKVFPDFTLDGFKQIFWLEYIHRVWGRLIGTVFALGFLYLLVRRRLTRAMAPHLLILFLLGAAQGALGWYMVASGLVDRPSVSHYRLAAHLMLAVAIYVYLVWFALGLRYPRGTNGERAALRRTASIAFVLIGLTILWGAFVAGLDAGKIYNTFPTMEGEWFPSDYFTRSPMLANLVENSVAVQFNHRTLAVLTVIAVIAFWALALKRSENPRIRRAAALLALAVLVQAALGVATLLAFVPVWLGVLHQAGAMLVVTVAVWAAHTFRHGAHPAAATIGSVRR